MHASIHSLKNIGGFEKPSQMSIFEKLKTRLKFLDPGALKATTTST